MNKAQINAMGWKIYGNRWPEMARRCPQMRGCLGWSWSDVGGWFTSAGKKAIDIYDTAKKGEAYQEITKEVLASQSSTMNKILIYGGIAAAALIAFKILAK